jgi:phosphatidylserine/phosphatidylglycerophosphate/cardiolipin synthase-like enzyme
MSFFSAVLAQKETAKSSFISAGLSPELERAVIALKMPEWLNEENIAQDNQARNVIVEEKLEIAKVRKMIQNAKQSIFLQSFLLSDSFIIEELEAAAKRGVWVLILTSDAIEKNNHQRLEDDIRTESYNSLIKKLANFSLVRFHEKAHPKFIVTDVMLNKSSNVGFFSTGNITKSGLEKNEERFVWLNEVQTKQLAAYFINMFQEAPKELNYKANKITRKSVETKSGNTGEFIFLGKKETQTLDYQILTDYIVKAKKAVFATYKLGDKNKFYDIVLEAAKHQVDITIRYNNTYLETSKFKKLGIKLEQNDLLHAKYIDLDYEDGSKKLFILSGNFDKKTSENKYEIIVEI